MWIPYRASLKITWFLAWFRLVPLGSTFAESYKLQHFGLVPGWFHLVPHSPNHANYNTLAWFRVGSTWLHIRGFMQITTLWLGSRLVPLGSALPRSYKLQHIGLVPGWTDIPRTVVHDKASYMAPPAHDGLQTHFASALRESGFRSWVGGEADSAKWMVRKLGDVNPHETAISHIRRLLDTDSAHTKLHETPAHFRQRVQKVEDFMNSDSFTAPGGAGLLGLAKSLRARCEEVVLRRGERIPK